MHHRYQGIKACHSKALFVLIIYYVTKYLLYAAKALPRPPHNESICKSLYGLDFELLVIISFKTERGCNTLNFMLQCIPKILDSFATRPYC